MGYNYDMAALESSAEFDAVEAKNGFASEEAYFEKLDEFVDNWKHYLRMYNPTVVIYSPDERANFLSEVDDIYKTAESLKLTRVLNELENLREVVEASQEKGLSDGLVKFFATLEIASGFLNAARIAGAPVMEAAPSESMKPAKKRVILAVDDRPEFLTLIMDTLGEEYKVIAMTEGCIALKALDIYEPSLFLLDIEMPEMSGIELAEKIREIDKHKKTPILFMTSKASRDYVLSAKTFGVNEYLLKPVEKNTLISKVKQYIG